MAEEAALELDTPLIRIDERMAEVACETGKRIGVIATLATTLGPTSRLVANTAAAMDKDVEIVDYLCEGAFEKLKSGDRHGHNGVVIAGIRELVDQVDVVVCAQASMAALLDELGEPTRDVIEPRFAPEAVRLAECLGWDYIGARTIPLAFDPPASAEPLTVALAMMRAAPAGLGTRVVVFGLGPIGLMCLRLARADVAALRVPAVTPWCVPASHPNPPHVGKECCTNFYTKT